MAKRRTSKKTAAVEATETSPVTVEIAPEMIETSPVTTESEPLPLDEIVEAIAESAPAVEEEPLSEDEVLDIMTDALRATAETVEPESEFVEALMNAYEITDEPETTVAAADDDLPQIEFDEAAATAALDKIDYKPIADQTWEKPVVVTVSETPDHEALMEGEITDEPETTVEPEPEPEEIEEVATQDAFLMSIGSIPQSEALEKARHIAKQIDDRKAFEGHKAATNVSIQKTLDSARKALSLSSTPARVFIAAKVDEGFINRRLHEGSLYNVYAIGKLADVVSGLGDGKIRNAINLACMKSLFACRKAGVVFNMDVAKACASNKLPVDASVRKHLIRHTVSASTAPTQASSTMQALVTLGIVSTSGSVKNPVYTLTDSPITHRLEQVLEAA